VDVRLEHVRNGHARRGGQVEYAVDVALRVYDEGDQAVVDQIAAVTQGPGCRSG
jgi:hypothetical protein